MKKLLKILGVLVLLVVLAAVAVYVWASIVTSRTLSQTIAVHTVDFPIPFPIDPDEAAGLGLDEAGLAQLAHDRAVERGRHLISARYACTACHGSNFGGGVMVDAFPIGHFLAPNLTTGAGSRTLDYKPSDWDHIVRHGVLPDGRPAVMPSDEFARMSDQELSDIVTYIRSLPPVDNTVAKSTVGPVGKILVLTKQLVPSALLIAHDAPHLVHAPVAEASADFGRHLANTCTGCHGTDLSGGPIPGGDPGWPQARNLTPDAATGLGNWTFEQFAHTLRTGQRPNGVALQRPMSEIVPYANSMTDVELRALWAYLRSVPPVSKSIPN